MSITYYFVCDTCKEVCWCGQARYIYKYDYIAEFLHNHVGHKLRFLDDNTAYDFCNEYTNIKESESMDIFRNERVKKC